MFNCHSSLSESLWQLAVSRAVVGLGAAGLELLVLVIINGTLNYSMAANAGFL